MKSFSSFIFLIFCFQTIQGLEWIAMDPSKNLPQGCVLGGIEQSKNYKGPLYIGRKQIENELVIGKVINDWKSGYFPKDGREHWSDHYEVLCGTGSSWAPKDGSNKNEISGGRAGNGEPLYVCAASVDGQLTPGKLYKPTGCCYVGLNGKEHCFSDYFKLTKGGSGFKQGFAHKTSVTVFFSEKK